MLLSENIWPDGTEGDYYLYPTYAPLNNANELLPGNKGYGFKASVDRHGS